MKYKRILLKLSGESLAGSEHSGIDEKRIEEYCRQIGEISTMGVEIGIVIGGGNIFRGLHGAGKGFDRINGDYMGMLATVINGLAFQSYFMTMGLKSRVFTAINMEPAGELFSRQKVMNAITSMEICIFTFGTGNPYFTTDTAAALRAVETESTVLLKGTRVDGVYTADPEKFPDAVRFDELSFDEAYQKKLKIMDLTAFTICRENNMQVLVFDMNRIGNLKGIVSGEKIGTLIRNY